MDTTQNCDTDGKDQASGSIGTVMSGHSSVKIRLEEALLLASGILRKMDAGWNAEIERLEQLQKRLGESRFHLAVLGQFKRGKSTLLNALLGEDVLPSAVVPLTAVPTLIVYGETRRVQLMFRDGNSQSFCFESPDKIRAFLREKATEEGNPVNRLGLDSITIQYPSPILSKGVVLIDTPGIGSTYEHNTKTTIDFLSRCDAAVFLVSADPPITQAEVDFLKKVGSVVPTLLFVLNKTDYLLPDELGMALSFLKQVLVKYGFSGRERIFCVSARSGLLARQRDDLNLWTESGMAEFYDYMVNFLASEKNRALYRSVLKRTENVIADISLRLELMRKALEMPLEDIDKRLAMLEVKLVEAEQQRQITGDLIQGEHRRAIELLEELVSELNRKVVDQVRGIVEEAVDSAQSSQEVERLARCRLNESIPQIFNDALVSISGAIRGRVESVLSTQRETGMAILDSVRRATAEVFNIGYVPPEALEVFGIKEEPFWITDNARFTLNPLPVGWADRLLSKQARIARVKRRLTEEVETVIARNVENLRFAMLQSIDSSFNRFVLTFNEQLDGTLLVIRDAIREIRSKKTAANQVVKEEVSRVDSFAAEIRKVSDLLERLRLDYGG